MWVKSVFGVPPPDVEAERDWVAWVYRQMESVEEQLGQVHHHEHKEVQVDEKTEDEPAQSPQRVVLMTMLGS